MGQPKLLVFGGSGFVGTRVCEEALKTGLAVVSVNRSGPPKLSADWVSSIEWIQVPYQATEYLSACSEGSPGLTCQTLFTAAHASTSVLRHLSCQVLHNELQYDAHAGGCV